MDANRWAQINQIFYTVVDRSPQEREALLSQACRDDTDLRREVETLINSHEQEWQFLETASAVVAADLLAEQATGQLAGQTLGHYQLIALLGAGGMGEVYRARDMRLERDVAVKVLTEQTARNPAALSQFEQEARAVAALSHPNILAIHDFGIEQNTTYAVMELLEGETLRAYLRRTRPDWRRATEIAAATAEGIAAAHRKSITHRDLKPENIFLTLDGQVKILDFGLAHAPVIENSRKPDSDTSLSSHSIPGAIMGTPGYMSPEQIRGAEVDARSDIFSFGCVCYELFMGQRVFSRPTLPETIAAVLRDEAPLIASDNDITAEIGRIVSRCLAKEPAERFASAQDLAAAFRRISAAVQAGANTISRLPVVARTAFALLITLFVLMLNPVSAVTKRMHSAGAIYRVRALAVLPFRNISGNSAEDYFAEGITELLIENLGRMDGLNVISSDSSERYQKGQNLAQIAQELKVDAVITGSVQRNSNQVEVSARLVHTASERILWSRSYSSENHEVLAAQNRMAQSIAQEINVDLTPQQQERGSGTGKVDPEALRFYFLAREHWDQRTEDGYRKAYEYFTHTLSRDPTFAPAYAGLADIYILGGSALPMNEAMQMAENYATRALSLDDRLAEAHASLAAVKMLYEWNWGEAENEFRLALQLNPSYATAYNWYAQYLTSLGRREEAIVAIRRAHELDPHSLVIVKDIGLHHYLGGFPDLAIEQAQATLRLDPAYAMAFSLLGRAYAKKGLSAEAVAAFRRAVELTPSPDHKAMLAYGYALAGRNQEARQMLNEVMSIAQTRPVHPVYLAAGWGALNEMDLAFAGLEKAFRERSGALLFLRVNPMLDSLRSDPRYNTLVQRIGFPD